MSPILMALLFAAGAGAGCALLLTPVRRWAERRSVLDIPNERSLHDRPTPRGGGLAILAATLAAWCLAMVTGYGITPGMWAYLVGATLVAGISMWDDLRSVSSGLRLLIHTVAAAIMVGTLGVPDSLVVPVVGSIHLGFWGAPIAVLWIVGLTNAYNFMDGIDGLAGSQGVVGGVAWAIFGWQGMVPAVSVLGLVLAFSCVAFLAQNWSPARLFMGDVGSAFLGYSFAILPLLYRTSASAEAIPRPAAAVALGALVTWPFLFDAAFTLGRRLLRHENVFAAHRTHLYQRLVISGLGHDRVSLCYAVLSALGLGFALAWPYGGILAEGLALLGPLSLGLVLWGSVAARERAAASTVPPISSGRPSPP